MFATEVVLYKGIGNRIFLCVALYCGAAFAQQQIDISGQDFISGKGDARLANLGSQAAASGKKLVITAPLYWHDKITAKIRNGGKAEIQLKDGFLENVLVRMEDKGVEPAAVERSAEPALPAKPTVAAKPIAKPVPAKPIAEKSDRKPASVKASPATVPVPTQTPPPVVAPLEETASEPNTDSAQPVTTDKIEQAAPADAKPIVESQPVESSVDVARQSDAPVNTPPSQIVEPQAKTPEPAATASASDATTIAEGKQTAAIKQQFEKILNEGNPANGTVSAFQLETNDIIYVAGKVRAVERSVGARSQLYWLIGELDFNRIEIKSLGKNRYQVITAIDDFNPLGSAVSRIELQQPEFNATILPATSMERRRLEQRYNSAHIIAKSLPPAQLRKDDVIHLGKQSAVVVRQTVAGTESYWVNGVIDLSQSRLGKDGDGTYRVLSDQAE